MSNVTYIVVVPCERLLGLSGETSYDATGNVISLEKANQKTLTDAAKKDEDKHCDEKGAEEDGNGNGNEKTPDSKDDDDSSDGDDEGEEELIDDDMSYSDGSDEIDEFEWMKSMHGEALIPDETSDNEPKRIAYCVAKLIHRGDIRDTFYADMEETSEGTVGCRR